MASRCKILLPVIYIALSLIIIASFLYAGPNELKSVMPEATYFKEVKEPFLYYIAYKKKEVIGYCFYTKDVVPEEKGYNGPIEMVVAIDKAFCIKHLKVLRHTETNAPSQGISEPEFLNQFKTKGPEDKFIIGVDIDAITQATISSNSVANMLKKALVKMKETISGEIFNSGVKIPIEKKGFTPREARYYKIID